MGAEGALAEGRPVGERAVTLDEVQVVGVEHLNDAVGVNVSGL